MSSDDSPAWKGRGGFSTTRWSLVLAAGEGGSERSERALAELCTEYWYPLYAYVRRRGNDPEDARDLTQAFFAKLLEKLFGRKSKRDYEKVRPLLNDVKAAREPLTALDDEALQAKTDEFRRRVADGEALDDLLPEAFGTVWEACRRLAERETAWPVWEHETVWDMIQRLSPIREPPVQLIAKNLVFQWGKTRQDLRVADP